MSTVPGSRHPPEPYRLPVSPRRRLSTSWAIALVGVTFVALGLWRVAIESVRSPVTAFVFGGIFVVMGLAGVLRERLRRGSR